MKDAASIAAFLGGVGVAGANAVGEFRDKMGYDEPQYGSLTIELPPAIPHEAAATRSQTTRDERVLALTIWGEARAHGEQGMRAVGHVVMNRVKSGLTRRFGRGIQGVALKDRQFSCWNRGDPNRAAMQRISELSENHPDKRAWKRARRIAREIISGQSRDPTRGALFYHTTDVNPSWNAEMEPIRTVANHVFYRGNREVIAAARRAAARMMGDNS